MAIPTEQTDFGAPFDYTDGDVYLRSVDGVHFRVHKLLLSTASVTFRELFASGSADTQRHSIPVIPLLAPEEDKAAVAAFLQIIYPVAFPSLQDIPLVRRVLELGRKYQADVIHAYIEGVLLQHPRLKLSPVTFYGIACIYRIERVAREAALECATQDLDAILRRQDQTDELALLSGADIHRLFDYRQRCASSLLSASSFQEIWDNCVICELMDNYRDAPVYLRRHTDDDGPDPGGPNRPCPVEDDYDMTQFVMGMHPRKWWTDYVSGCIKAIRAHPQPAVVRSPELVGRALVSAGRCEACRDLAPAHLQTFVNNLERHLNWTLNQVGTCSPDMVRK
jgi:hypothetical protein